MGLRQFPLLLPFIGMVLAMTMLATNMIISKLAMSSGTSFYILSVYSHGLASLVLVPAAFLFNRTKIHPVSFPVIWRVFVLALCGSLADIGSYAGINYSSPTLGSELLNLVPAFAYILAIIFRMEKLDFKRFSGIFKFLGALVLIIGASFVTLYKGEVILNKPLSLGSFGLISASQHNWIAGGILLSLASFLTAAWSIVQASILKIYPIEMTVVGIYCIFVTAQSMVIALIAERDLTAWKMNTKIGLVAVLYAGLINIALRLYLMSWCLTRTGPLFVTLFNPLVIVLSIAIGVIFLNEALYIGSIVGSIVLVIGLYAFVWGKSQENSMKEDRYVQKTSQEAPLLQGRIEEDEA